MDPNMHLIFGFLLSVAIKLGQECDDAGVTMDAFWRGNYNVYSKCLCC
jgi:hypothetical protein